MLDRHLQHVVLQPVLNWVLIVNVYLCTFFVPCLYYLVVLECAIISYLGISIFPHILRCDRAWSLSA